MQRLARKAALMNGAKLLIGFSYIDFLLKNIS